MMKSILEAKDVTVYKRLIQVLGDYSKSFPFTGVDKLFQQAINQGKKIMPTDKFAIQMICNVLEGETSSGIVQRLLNTRFADLPAEVRPMSKKGRTKEVAFWMLRDRMGDKLLDLINFDGEGKGHWVTADGEKASLIDMNIKKSK